MRFVGMTIFINEMTIESTQAILKLLKVTQI